MYYTYFLFSRSNYCFTCFYNTICYIYFLFSRSKSPCTHVKISNFLYRRYCALTLGAVRVGIGLTQHVLDTTCLSCYFRYQGRHRCLVLKPDRSLGSVNLLPLCFGYCSPLVQRDCNRCTVTEVLKQSNTHTQQSQYLSVWLVAGRRRFSYALARSESRLRGSCIDPREDFGRILISSLWGFDLC